MRKILVTGVSGFIGGEVYRQLANAEWCRPSVVYGTDIIPSQYVTPDYLGDLCDPDFVKNIAHDTDTIIHCAAKVPITQGSWSEFIVNNCISTFNLLELGHPKNFIHISSSAVYGKKPKCPITEDSPFEPFEPYGESKLVAEQIAKSYRTKGVNVIVLRPRTVIGPGRMGMFAPMFQRIKEGKTVISPWRPDTVLQMLSLRDLVDAVMLTLQRINEPLVANQDFNLGTTMYCHTIRTCLQRAFPDAKFLFLHWLPFKSLARLLYALKLSPYAPWHYETIGNDFYYHPIKAISRLGWCPTDSNAKMLQDAYESYLHATHATHTSPHLSPLTKPILGLWK